MTFNEDLELQFIAAGKAIKSLEDIANLMVIDNDEKGQHTKPSDAAQLGWSLREAAFITDAKEVQLVRIGDLSDMSWTFYFFGTVEEVRTKLNSIKDDEPFGSCSSCGKPMSFDGCCTSFECNEYFKGD